LVDAGFQKGQDVLKFRPIIFIGRDEMFVGFKDIARLVVFTFLWAGKRSLAMAERRHGLAGVDGQETMEPEVADQLEIPS
jgi:hypothetical protein